MDTIIIYATKYGCTEKCAKLLKEGLKEEAALCNLKKDQLPDLTHYDRVIIGGPIRVGKIEKEVSDFCTKHLNVLKDKKLGLFICCMREGEIAEAELKDAFPEDLLKIAAAKEYFGGEFIFDKMNFMDKLIVKKVAKINQDTSNVIDANIQRFISQINDV